LTARAAAGDARAAAALRRHAGRLARALAQVVNLLDPDCVVLGGGLSNMAHLYDEVPAALGAAGCSATRSRRQWCARGTATDPASRRGAVWNLEP
jgi:predicted NBD/HSP70 family sugar kinase